MKSRAQILAETFEGHNVDYSKIWADADPDWKRRWEAVANSYEPCPHCPNNGVLPATECKITYETMAAAIFNSGFEEVVVESYSEPRFVHWRDRGRTDEMPIEVVDREISRPRDDCGGFGIAVLKVGGQPHDDNCCHGGIVDCPICDKDAAAYAEAYARHARDHPASTSKNEDDGQSKERRTMQPTKIAEWQGEVSLELTARTIATTHGAQIVQRIDGESKTVAAMRGYGAFGDAYGKYADRHWRDYIGAARAVSMMQPYMPPHACSASITHNQHLNYHETVAQYEQSFPERFEDSWVSQESRAWAIEHNVLWEIQWYPQTPNGFCVAFAGRWEDLVAHLNITVKSL